MNSTTRTEQIFKQIIDLVDRYKPECIIFEDCFLSVNPDALKQLCRLQGYIMSLCYLRNLGFRILLPSEWRSKLWENCGRGRAIQKEKAVDYVNEKYKLNLTYKDDDQAEAICIGEAFIKIMDMEE